ncbi:N amino acid transport system protein [Pseudocercospora fuligena]|uniref:N amino acid transport system protein n=1 Tax=Pseudocercospora fuligena TaxID=685502 RepID=A0A8H6VKN5_9PEZI|nr:N amino acid transport system protein [Pseudocercospora fuligena]
MATHDIKTDPWQSENGGGEYRRTSFGIGEKRRLSAGSGRRASYGYDPAIEISATNDAVFGDVSNGPNYRAVGWAGAVVLMLKTQIGLGVLGIPLVFDTIGMVPGVICLLALAIMTTWSDYIVGVFKINHPEVYGIDDVGGLIAGRAGYIIMGTVFCLFWIFVAGSAMVSISIALNALSLHGACTAIFVAVAAIIGFLVSSIQTLHKISWIAWVGVVGIISSILVLTIAVGLQDRPSDAPQTGIFVSDYKITANPSPASAFQALSTLVFAYAGTPAFFSIVSEMREPRQYGRSMFICQGIVTALYLAIGIVVYYFCGSYVASPALGSAGQLFKRICYGLALPGLLASMILLSHVPAKYIFIRILKGTRHLSSNTPTHWIVWLSCTAGIALVSYILAEAIPVFGELVSFAGAAFGTLLCLQPMGAMWLYDNWGRSDRGIKWKLMVAWSIFIIVGGTFLTIAGTYGSIVGIINALDSGSKTSPWSCADNSNSS